MIKNVLSLFDGISCGKLALQRAGFSISKYYASEVDKSAVAVSKKNNPDVVHLGDVQNWRNWDIDWGSIDLLIGGSPCQGFSSSGKGLNFEDPRSKLFFVYVEILNYIRKFNPKVRFLLENVAMKKEWTDVISYYLDVPYVEINSKYFSAQNRVRFYWANFDIVPYADAGIELSDIVDDAEYCNSAAIRTRPIAEENHRKSLCLEVNDSKKSLCLVTVNLNNLLSSLPKGRYKDINSHNYPYRVMSVREMERLQTLPEGYVGNITQNKAAKVLGNGWTVDVIAHIFSSIYLGELY